MGCYGARDRDFLTIARSVPSSPLWRTNFRDNRRMVGRSFAFARFQVDGALNTSLGELLRQQYVVYPQAKIAAETVHSIIPPGERSFGLFEQAKAVRKTEDEQSPKRIAFRLAA